MMNIPPKLRSWYFRFSKSRKQQYLTAAVLDLILILIILFNGTQSARMMIGPLVSPYLPLSPLSEGKHTKQIFGFAPHWNIDKLDSVDFNILTTFAYFGVEVGADGNLVTDDPGYDTFRSEKATSLFKKAHAHGTRVVLTLTQMDNWPILALMDNPQSQSIAIDQAVSAVKDRGIDGLNIDFEYSGDPGQAYRDKFTRFVADMTQRMHQEIPSSQVTVSVYASAVKDPKIYDIAALSKVADGIFMMAYDFAVASSANAIPTSPLNGHKEGKYWYDVTTAVDDFLKYMAADKLILGVPYYGYNYLVYQPAVKAETRPLYSWRGKPASQTYSVVWDKFKSDEVEGIDEIKRGWDEDGKVSYIAYHVEDTDTWRMIFMEDTKSLGLKYDFAKSKNLGGVGMWALGNDENKNELWALLKDKFGSKDLADRSISQREVVDLDE